MLLVFGFIEEHLYCIFFLAYGVIRKSKSHSVNVQTLSSICKEANVKKKKVSSFIFINESILPLFSCTIFHGCFPFTPKLYTFCYVITMFCDGYSFLYTCKGLQILVAYIRCSKMLCNVIFSFRYFLV